MNVSYFKHPNFLDEDSQKFVFKFWDREGNKCLVVDNSPDDTHYWADEDEEALLPQENNPYDAAGDPLKDSQGNDLFMIFDTSAEGMMANVKYYSTDESDPSIQEATEMYEEIEHKTSLSLR